MNQEPTAAERLAGSRRAIIRAARRAADLARQHHQPLALWQDGKVVEVYPDDLPPLPEEAPMAEPETPQR